MNKKVQSFPLATDGRVLPTLTYADVDIAEAPLSPFWKFRTDTLQLC